VQGGEYVEAGGAAGWGYRREDAGQDGDEGEDD
jgi:hypothetical protein